jgi:tRNA threonylcarbamoyladenosine biosynthesis protein TsaE
VISLSSPEQTQAVGEALGRALREAGARGAVLALTGPLGAGKTCLVQGIARGFGAAGYVRSPTFTLIHEYRGPTPLYHVDLYRIDAADLDGLGLEEIVDGPGLTVIEWADPRARIFRRITCAWSSSSGRGRGIECCA